MKRNIHQTLLVLCMGMVLLLVVGWKPGDDANCPDDQPIGACDLGPEQQIYTITISAAMQ